MQGHKQDGRGSVATTIMTRRASSPTSPPPRAAASYKSSTETMSRSRSAEAEDDDDDAVDWVRMEREERGGDRGGRRVPHPPRRENLFDDAAGGAAAYGGMYSGARTDRTEGGGDEFVGMDIDYAEHDDAPETEWSAGVSPRRPSDNLMVCDGDDANDDDNRHSHAMGVGSGLGRRALSSTSLVDMLRIQPICEKNELRDDIDRYDLTETVQIFDRACDDDDLSEVTVDGESGWSRAGGGTGEAGFLPDPLRPAEIGASGHSKDSSTFCLRSLATADDITHASSAPDYDYDSMTSREGGGVAVAKTKVDAGATNRARKNSTRTKPGEGSEVHQRYDRGARSRTTAKNAKGKDGRLPPRTVVPSMQGDRDGGDRAKEGVCRVARTIIVVVVLVALVEAVLGSAHYKFIPFGNHRLLLDHSQQRTRSTLPEESPAESDDANAAPQSEEARGSWTSFWTALWPRGAPRPSRPPSVWGHRGFPPPPHRPWGVPMRRASPSPATLGARSFDSSEPRPQLGLESEMLVSREEIHSRLSELILATSRGER